MFMDLSAYVTINKVIPATPCYRWPQQVLAEFNRRYGTSDDNTI